MKYIEDKRSYLDEFFDALVRQDSAYLDYARMRRREYFKALSGQSVVAQVKWAIDNSRPSTRLVKTMVY